MGTGKKKIQDSNKSDAVSKSLFHNKDLMAEMLMGFTEEFEHMSREEVVKCIDLNPSDNSVRGLNGEMNLPDSAPIRLDTLIDATVPGTGSRVRIKFNIECQMNFRPGYELTNRAQDYGAVLLGTQNKGQSSVKRYKNLSRVYTVWLCLNCTDNMSKGTVSRYGVLPRKPRHGEVANYTLNSLIEIVIVCLNDGTKKQSGTEISESETRIVHILNTLFMEDMTDGERKQALKEKYNISLDLSTIKEVKILTDLLKEEYENGMIAGIAEGKAEGKAEGIAEGKVKGITEGRIEQCVETLLHLLRDENLPRETAIRYANVPDDCRNQVISEVDRRLNVA